MTKHILTVTLNPAVDRTIIVPGFNLHQDHFLTKEFLTAGGKGFNVSRALQSMGVESVATGIIAGNSGRLLRRLSRDEGLKTRLVNVRLKDGQTRINVTIVGISPSSKTRILSEGPALNKDALKQFESQYVRSLKKASFVVLSGRNACRAPDPYYARLINLAKKNHIPVVFDASGNPLKEGLKAGPLIIKPNRQEAQEVLGYKLSSEKKIIKAFKDFHASGIAYVLLSLDEQGAAGSDGKNRWLVTPPRISVRNEVGCGDSFVAGFLCGYANGKDFLNSLKLAVCAGTANAMNYRPGHSLKKDIQKLLKQIKIKKI